MPYADDSANSSVFSGGNTMLNTAQLLVRICTFLPLPDVSRLTRTCRQDLSSAELASAAETLRFAEAPRASVDSIRRMRHDLAALLTHLLVNDCIPNKRRKIKAYYYAQSAAALRSLEDVVASGTGMHPLLTATAQAKLLEDALGFMRFQEICRPVANNVTTVGLRQKALKDAKNALRGARETVVVYAARFARKSICQTIVLREALAAFVSRAGEQVDESLMRLANHDALSAASSSN